MAIIIGLTGGIGSGKTTIMKYLEDLGYHVYYADDAGKKVMQNKEIIHQVVSVLGKEVLLENGSLDRKAIANLVFSNEEKLKQLNDIIHPAVARDFKEFEGNLAENELLVKESALLFETKANESCDFTILVTAPEEVRVKRVMERDKISEIDIKNRIKHQLSEKEKAKKADFVINNLNLNDSFEEISRIFDKIKHITG